MLSTTRRDFLRTLGVSAAALPFITNLPGLAFANSTQRKKRMVVIFTPNGVVPWNFWPDETGDKFTLKESVKPLEAFQSKMLFLKGISDKVRGDGDGHMRGIGCLLTGIELFPGNIQGGSDTPAGWSMGHSIDQEIKSYLQKDPATKTRFGSLEFGALVPERADTWTRMVYAGPNKPIAPIDNPYQMFNKLYGRAKDNAEVASILDDLNADLKKIAGTVSSADKKLLDEHMTFVREMEQELKADRDAQAKSAGHKVPEIEPGVRRDNDTMPKISKMQMDLLFNSFQADFTRIATFQFTNSVGMARMRWLGIDKGHHELSHEPDSNKDAMDQLTKINKWFAEQIAYLAKKLADTPEPGSTGSMLDHTTIVWTNELGAGNSHTHDNTPFLMIGGGLGFKMGRSLNYKKEPHNRLLVSLAHAFGHHIPKFGNGDYCKAGPLGDLT